MRISPAAVARTEPAAGATPRAPSAFDDVHPRFTEQGELGRGGMGRVAEAFDRTLARTVAIKHMLVDDDASLLRFEREVRITAQLQHPSIVPVLDAGRDDDGLPYYVMRKIDGIPLSDRVQDARTVAARLALLPALLGAVDAAAYAHARGIVHRDIKPPNILLGPFGETLLIDWGLARVLDEPVDATTATRPAGGQGLTVQGIAYGTPGYMAPEQARGEPADARADVYALGATLYFVLRGRSPFAGSTATEVIARSAAGEGPDLQELPAEIPVELVAIVEHALAPRPEDRYPTAGDLAADLRRYIAGQLVAAHRYTLGQLVARWVRRHRWITAVSAAALVSVAAIGAIAFRTTVHERDEAERARSLAEERGEEQLVDRARALVTVDPTSAVALLRTLSPTSSRWSTARQIVRAAVSLGVEWGLTAHHGRVVALAFSPGGTLASAGRDDTIWVHDVARRSSRVLLRDRAVDSLRWLDDEHLVWSATTEDSGQVGIVAVSTGTSVVVPLPAIRDLAVASGVLYVLDRGGVVHEVQGNGTHVERARDAIAIASNGAALVTLERDRMAVRAPGAPDRDLAVSRFDAVEQVAMSRDGNHIAVSTYSGLREWNVGAGRELAPVAIRSDDVQRILYVGDELYVERTDGSVLAARDSQPVHGRSWWPRGKALDGVHAARDAAFATRTGELAIASELGIVEIPHRSVELSALAISHDGRWLATGTLAGTVPILDLQPVAPRIVPLASDGALLAVDARDVLVAERARGGEVARVDHETAARRVVATAELGAFGTLAAGFAVVATGGASPQLRIEDRDGHVVTEVNDVHISTVGPALDADGVSVFYVDTDGQITERRLAAGAAARVLGTIPASPGARRGLPVASLAAHDGVVDAPGIAVPPATSTLYTFDRHGLQQRPSGVPGAVIAQRRDVDDVLWFVVDFTDLYRMPPGGVARRIAIPEPVRNIRLESNEVWAKSQTTMYRIERRTGVVLQRSALSGVTSSVPGGYTEQTSGGITVQMPLANVRRELRVPVAPKLVVSSDDGRAIAAQLDGPGEGGAVVVWVDPVPLDAIRVRTYLDAITNAHVELGADAVSWEPSAPSDTVRR